MSSTGNAVLRADKVWMDGRLIKWDEANVHVMTHALHYGGAVFEGERCYGGEIFKLEEHTERLLEEIRGMSPWHLDIPLTESLSTGTAFGLPAIR